MLERRLTCRALGAASLCALAIAGTISSASGQDDNLPEPPPGPGPIFAPEIMELCGTQTKWAAENPFDPDAGIAGACPLEGECDDPTVRDGFIPTGATPIKTVRLRFHVFANTDGTNPASSVAEVNAQVAQLNADFLPHRFQFIHTTEIINDSTYRQFNPNTEDAAMRNAYADSPATQCNVYVTNVTCCYGGLGTFPWDPNALNNLGGIIMDDDVFDGTNHTLTHEVGHNLGLWHTHHGVSEVDVCGVCYEFAASNSSVNGDFCGDTPPTPTNLACGAPGGNDVCSGNPWGATQTANYMGYGGNACWSLFTAQQGGRMHCWTTDVLQGWLDVPPPPCPGAGDCFVAHATPGCNNAECCSEVCAADPFCCNVQWDGLCVSGANTLCTGCGGAGVGSCYVSHTNPWCDDPNCCNAVCADDPFCCNTSWDNICVGGAQLACNSCGGSATGSCYVVHSNPKCNNFSCCNEVCGLDPFCCNVSWDSLCVNEALDFCDVTVIAGPIVNPANGNQYYLLSQGSWQNCSSAAVALGGNLATINNAAENAWVRTNLANNGGVPREVWLGYNDVAAEGAFVWSSGQTPGYTNWNGGEPNNLFDEDYTEMYPAVGVWNDHNKYGGANNFAVAEVEVLGKCGDILAGDCYTAHGTPYCNNAACCFEVCDDDPFCCSVQWDGLCVQGALDECVEVIAGPIVNPANGNHYYLLTKASWTAAQAFAQGMGGNLVTIRDAAENTWVRNNVGGFGGTFRSVWLGYNDQDAEGTFEWVSGQGYTYTNWAPGSPNDAGNEDYVRQQPLPTAFWDDFPVYGNNIVHGAVEVEVLSKCGNVLAGGCFVSHPGPYCTDAQCCTSVCAVDPFCCNVSWDGICANEAEDMCGCPADIAPGGGNGFVNVDDLLLVITSWGACSDCLADLVPPGNNGQVNVDDLLKVINNWGACPGCSSPFNCGTAVVNCPSGGPSCVCFQSFLGDSVCALAASCDIPCVNGVCPPGFECVINTCCGGPVCLPVCGTSLGAPPAPGPGDPTVLGKATEPPGGGGRD